jgi:hypothetical protein
VATGAVVSSATPIIVTGRQSATQPDDRRRPGLGTGRCSRIQARTDSVEVTIDSLPGEKFSGRTEVQSLQRSMPRRRNGMVRD